MVERGLNLINADQPDEVTGQIEPKLGINCRMLLL